MNPSDRVERCNFSNLFWQLISTWPLLEKEFKKGNLFAEWRLWVFSRCKFYTMYVTWKSAVTGMILVPAARAAKISEYSRSSSKSLPSVLLIKMLVSTLQ